MLNMVELFVLLNVYLLNVYLLNVYHPHKWCEKLEDQFQPAEWFQ